MRTRTFKSQRTSNYLLAMWLFKSIVSRTSWVLKPLVSCNYSLETIPRFIQSSVYRLCINASFDKAVWSIGSKHFFPVSFIAIIGVAPSTGGRCLGFFGYNIFEFSFATASYVFGDSLSGENVFLTSYAFKRELTLLGLKSVSLLMIFGLLTG